MSAPEINTRADHAVSNTLNHIVHNFGFDNFLHFSELARFGTEAGISPDEWDTLLREWPYKPVASMEKNQRGNCVDFALYTQYAMGRVGIEAQVIGKKPEMRHSPQGEQIVFQRHAAAISGPPGQRQMYEPGRRLAGPIYLDPIGRVTDAGRQVYRTIDITDDWLVQEQSFRDSGYTGTREFSLQPLSAEEATAIPVQLFRIPRNMEMITKPSDETHMVIEYDRRSDTLTSNIEGLPAEFTPTDISSKKNEQISAVYGFDVQEELVAAMGIFRAFPKEFWVR